MKVLKMAICVLLACVVLASCANKRLMPSGDKLVDGKTDIEYNVASASYEPVSLGKEFARSDRQGYEITYYQIGELSTDEWLCDGEYNVYYADGVKLPSFEEMNFNRILVCQEDEALVSIKDITEKKLVLAVIDGYKNGEASEYIGLKADVILELKFRSAIYPYLQYSLSYYEYTDGCIIEDKTDDISSYKYITADESVEITTTENDDGSYTVTYNYGKYFIRNESDGAFVKVSEKLHEIIGSVSDE